MVIVLGVRKPKYGAVYASSNSRTVLIVAAFVRSNAPGTDSDPCGASALEIADEVPLIERVARPLERARRTR
jgi:hypothetical protein